MCQPSLKHNRSSRQVENKIREVGNIYNIVEVISVQISRVIINDGTMRIGIFDPDKEKAMEAARQLIMF